VVERAVAESELSHGVAYKIFFSPAGQKLNQDNLKRLAYVLEQQKHIMLLPARYEGMDSRVEEYYADIIISIGDFVVMGGDLPAMMLLEGALRLMPGVVGNQESVVCDSFSGAFVDYPEYTTPVVWNGIEVPAVVRSGNHELIRAWREQRAIERTVLEHFDWMREHPVTSEQRKIISHAIPAHYAVLMHTDVVLAPDNRKGETSVTSLDIHDIARSAKTFGLQGYFIVTPLEDQKRITQKLLDFWQHGVGVSYNPCRHDALKAVKVMDSLDAVIEEITIREGKKPIVMTTSAKAAKHVRTITYHDQAQVWQEQRPVMIVFGTGNGLSDDCIARADFNVCPIAGYSTFNHLSVRSAAAIVFDRWLGMNPRRCEVKSDNPEIKN